MRKKEKREVYRSWAFVIVGSILAFFISMTANALFDILKHYGFSSWGVLLLGIFGIWYGVFTFNKEIQKLR